MFKQRYTREQTTYKVSAFIGPGGKIVSDFKDCTVVMVSPVDPMKGSSLPHSSKLFRVGTKIGDVFTEVIRRFDHQEEE